MHCTSRATLLRESSNPPWRRFLAHRKSIEREGQSALPLTTPRSATESSTICQGEMNCPFGPPERRYTKTITRRRHRSLSQRVDGVEKSRNEGRIDEESIKLTGSFQVGRVCGNEAIEWGLGQHGRSESKRGEERDSHASAETSRTPGMFDSKCS